MDSFGTVKLSYLLILGTTLLTQAGIAYWVYRYQWEQSGAKWFLVMVGTGFVWVLPIFLTVLVSNDTFQAVAYGVAHLGIILTAGAFVVFTSKYTDSGYHRNRLIQASLLGILGAYLVLAPTNSLHGLVFAKLEPRSEPFEYMAIVRGPAYQAMALFIQLPVLYSAYRIAEHLSATRQRASVQLALFVLGALSIVALENVDQWTSILPASGFPNATLGMFAFYVFVTLALFRFNLLDAKPVARNTVIEDLHNPVLVVDERGRVVDYNETASDVWPDIDDQMREQFATACPDLAAEISIPPTDDSPSRITLTSDGEQRHYAVTVSSVTVEGTSTGWHSILLRDVTELQRSRERLEAQNERLNKVASTISHDLRNPINVAMGHVQLLESKVDDEELLEHVEKTRATHDRMLDIIEDILTLAREGETVEETERLDLEAVATEAWKHVETKSGTLAVERSRSLQADRSKLLTIFENLFRNTFDHGSADARVEVGATETGFYVQDDGPGIPEESVDDVFEFGYTTADGGTGLGLSIVEMMARSHGWEVELDADYDRGARFTFSGVEEGGPADGDDFNLSTPPSEGTENGAPDAGDGEDVAP